MVVFNAGDSIPEFSMLQPYLQCIPNVPLMHPQYVSLNILDVSPMLWLVKTKCKTTPSEIESATALKAAKKWALGSKYRSDEVIIRRSSESTIGHTRVI